MFTGIVEAIGEVSAVRPRLAVACSLRVEVGDSVCVDGVCLTAVSASDRGFEADLSEETRRRTTLRSVEPGRPVNLERAMSPASRFGGHLVQGHVDGTARVSGIDEKEQSREVWLEADGSLIRYIVEKGSVALDGVSLTIAGLDDSRFMVSLIPHTFQATNLDRLRPGDEVNLEVDVIARYVEKLLGG